MSINYYKELAAFSLKKDWALIGASFLLPTTVAATDRGLITAGTIGLTFAAVTLATVMRKNSKHLEIKNALVELGTVIESNQGFNQDNGKNNSRSNFMPGM